MRLAFFLRAIFEKLLKKQFRCKDGQWMVYMNDISYLAENDPSGDPTSWVMYNNIFCVRELLSQLKSRTSTIFLNESEIAF